MVPLAQRADPLRPNLRIALLRFRITPKILLIVPAMNKGNMLRGGFGHAFRRLCCMPQCRDAKTCPVAASCPYKLIFEPSPPPDAERLSKNQDIPRPFIFRPPPTTQTHFEPGQSFEFELVLIGQALEYIPYFVLAFRELAEGGLGLNRSRCTLDSVEELGLSSPAVGDSSAVANPRSKVAPVYSSEDQLFRTVKGIDSSEWIESRINQLTADHGPLTISFLTPTFIRTDGRVIREPEFHHIFKRLRDRINALSTFFGEAALDVDFRGLGERSEKIKRVAGRFEWIDRARTSTKTGQRHELSGFVGGATYEGELDEFLPWLVMGELMHVGRFTAWGHGRFEIRTG